MGAFNRKACFKMPDKYKTEEMTAKTNETDKHKMNNRTERGREKYYTPPKQSAKHPNGNTRTKKFCEEDNEDISV